VLGSLACWGLAELLEMVVVVFHPGHLSVLPPPSSWWVQGAVLATPLLSVLQLRSAGSIDLPRAIVGSRTWPRRLL
jgi:hypothetical protein